MRGSRAGLASFLGSHLTPTKNKLLFIKVRGEPGILLQVVKLLGGGLVGANVGYQDNEK